MLCRQHRGCMWLLSSDPSRAGLSVATSASRSLFYRWIIFVLHSSNTSKSTHNRDLGVRSACKNEAWPGGRARICTQPCAREGGGASKVARTVACISRLLSHVVDRCLIAWPCPE